MALNDWESLSMKERALYIRLAVANGLHTVDDIRNSYKEGGYIYEKLPLLLREAGLNIKVTSGLRGPRYKGDKSRHMHNKAVDIVPQGKTTFEDIEKAVYSNPAIYNYMLDNGLGLLDETGRTQASRNTMKKTRATGAHFHFGDDEIPAKRFADKMSSLWDNKMERLNTSIASPPTIATPTFRGLPLYNPYTFNSPLLDSNEGNVPKNILIVEELPIQKLPSNIIVEEEPLVNPLDIIASILNAVPSIPTYNTPRPLTATEILALREADRNTLLTKEFENSLLRDNLLGIEEGNMFGGGGNKSSFVRSLETQPTILELVAEYNKEPKVRKVIKETIKQQRIREQKTANQRERNIAKQYLAAGPNIGNLAKAAYHWYNSVPILGGQPEDGNDYITGVVDAPGIRNPKEILNGTSTLIKGLTNNRLRNIFNSYEKSLTQYKGAKLPNSLEYKFDTPKINIDFNNLTTDNFVDYLSKQTGRTIKRVPIRDTEHGELYKQGFSFIDDEGKELAYIAGRKEAGDNVWVGASYVAPEFRHQGLGKQMYFDFNDHVFNTYGTTLHSSPYQRVGSTGAGVSPSNRLWKSLRDNGMAFLEGNGLNRYDVMAEPKNIITAYRTQKAFGGNLFGGGGIFEDIGLGQVGSTLDTVTSYLPIASSIQDTYSFIKEPSWENLGWAAASIGTDLIGAGLLKGVKAATKTYKAAKKAEETAKKALETHRKTNRNIIARSLREEDKALQSAYNNSRMETALANPFWDKVIEYPVAGAWMLGDAGINHIQNTRKNYLNNKKALGGDLFSTDKGYM